MMTRNTGESDFTFRLGGYLMTAGGLGLAAGAANAAVTQINVTQTVTANGGSQTYYVDLDNDSVDDFYFSVEDGGPGNPGRISASPASGTLHFHVSQRGSCAVDPYYAGNVSPGTSIDATLFNPSGYSWPTIWSPNRINDCNNFVTGQWGILAFRKETTPGNYVYGYLNIRQSLGSNILDIDGGAYESTPNAPIAVPDPAAGEPRPVPVGPAVPLGISLLVAGAAAMRLRAKRKPH